MIYDISFALTYRLLSNLFHINHVKCVRRNSAFVLEFLFRPNLHPKVYIFSTPHESVHLHKLL